MANYLPLGPVGKPRRRAAPAAGLKPEAASAAPRRPASGEEAAPAPSPAALPAGRLLNVAKPSPEAARGRASASVTISLDTIDLCAARRRRRPRRPVELLSFKLSPGSLRANSPPAHALGLALDGRRARQLAGRCADLAAGLSLQQAPAGRTESDINPFRPVRLAGPGARARSLAPGQKSAGS